MSETKNLNHYIEVVNSSNEVDRVIVQEAVWKINTKEVRFRHIEKNNGSSVLIFNEEKNQWHSFDEANNEESELIELIEDICEYEDIDGFQESDHIKWNGEDIMYI
jgi:hypothetical protein